MKRESKGRRRRGETRGVEEDAGEMREKEQEGSAVTGSGGCLLLVELRLPNGFHHISFLCQGPLFLVMERLPVLAPFL